MLHGWGFHGGVWDDMAANLGCRYRIYQVDLPGHGRSPVLRGNNLSDWVDLLLSQLPANAIWVGWSLGGLTALAAAARKALRALVTVAATPRFQAAPDWPHAVPAEVLEQFARQLPGNRDNTLQRFAALMVQGSADARQHIRRLRGILAMRPQPCEEALLDGLRLLRDSDLRAACADIQVPMLVVGGGQDRLVPPRSIADWQKSRSALRCHNIAEAAHIPFLSHPAEFLQTLNVFLHELPAG